MPTMTVKHTLIPVNWANKCRIPEGSRFLNLVGLPFFPLILGNFLGESEVKSCKLLVDEEGTSTIVLVLCCAV